MSLFQGILLVGLLALAAVATAQGVTVGLMPSTITVQPGSQFELDLE